MLADKMKWFVDQFRNNVDTTPHATLVLLFIYLWLLYRSCDLDLAGSVRR